MGVIQNFPFSDDINYITSNVAIAAGVAKLALVPNTGQVFAQDFASSTGFTFDAALAEFVGGVVRQKDLRPAGAVLGGKFNTFNLDWINSGALTGTVIGTPTLVGGKLSALAFGNHGVHFNSAAIGAVGPTGCIRFKYTPQYTGTPASNVAMIEFKDPAGTAKDQLLIMHAATGGTIRLTGSSSTGAAVWGAVTMGAGWSPVAGTEYEIALNWDMTTSIVRLFINGVLWGTASSGTFVRANFATRLYIGAGGTYTTTNALFDDVVLFPTVQQTTGYTPGYTLPDFPYAASTVVLPAFAYTGVGTILAVEASAVTETGTPRYIVGGKYWNGTAWVTSDNTYAQANTSAQVIADLTSLVVVGATSVVVKALFADAQTQSDVDSISVTVTGQKYSATGYVEPLQAIQAQALLSYVQTVLTPGTATLKIIIKVDGVLKWHNGTIWTTSDGTAAQANTEAQLNANFAALDFGVNSSVILRWVLSTSSNIETPELDDATIDYDFGGVGVEPVRCTVFGYLKDITNAPVAGATLKFDLLRTSKKEYKEANKNIILNPTVSVVSDADGYFEVDLIRSSEFEGLGTYRVAITKAVGLLEASKIGTASLDFLVPDADQKDLTELFTAA